MVHTSEDEHCYTDKKNGCTKIEEGVGARISVCWGSESGGDRREIPCQEVADYTRLLAEKFGKDQRAGGRVYNINAPEGAVAAQVGGYVQISRKK